MHKNLHLSNLLIIITFQILNLWIAIKEPIYQEFQKVLEEMKKINLIFLAVNSI
jgi:hypothetical protein